MLSDEALVTLEYGGYIALPADYPRPNAEWGTLDEIEKRGPESKPDCDT